MDYQKNINILKVTKTICNLFYFLKNFEKKNSIILYTIRIACRHHYIFYFRKVLTMKRFTTLFLAAILAVTLLFGGTMSVLASAEEELSSISPRLSNCNTATMRFAVVDNLMCAGISYSAKEDVFTHAKLTLSFKKKYMLFFWKTVEIGYIDEEWTGYCYDVFGEFYQEFPATGSGTYRAYFTFEVYGTSGVTDVIEDTIDYDY